VSDRRPRLWGRCPAGGPGGLALQLQFWLLRLSAYALLNLADDAALLALMFC
jgi:hypothetical protein